MKIKSIKTRRFKAPKDNLSDLLSEVAKELSEGCVVAVSSKVVSICEGACRPVSESDYNKLVKQESDVSLSSDSHRDILTKHNDVLVEYGGIDVSRTTGYYILLPPHPYKSALKIWRQLRRQSGIRSLGVVITDSHAVPFRRGSIGMAVAGYGFKPVNYYKTQGSNRLQKAGDLLDGLAAAATVVMGEGGHTPLAVITEIPNIDFFRHQLAPLMMRRYLYVRPNKEVYKNFAK